MNNQYLSPLCIHGGPSETNIAVHHEGSLPFRFHFFSLILLFFLSSCFLSISQQAIEAGLCSIWLSGLLLIALSLYATQCLPSFKDHFVKPELGSKTLGDSLNPSISIFSAPRPFVGNIGVRQSLAIRSWLALSPQITVILFSQDPSIVSSASSFSSRVYIDSDIDFT